MRKAHGVSHKSRVLKLELEIYRSLCDSIGTPRALACKMLAEAGEWVQLISMKCNPASYNDAEHFALDYLITETLKKNPRLPLGIDTKAAALHSFWAAEEKCRETNDRFLDLGSSPEFLLTLERHRAALSRTLGPLTSQVLNRIEENMRFGPGATTSLSGIVTKGAKFAQRTLETTPRLVAPYLLSKPVNWPITDLSVRKGSKLTTVPKNAKTDRVICIEPDVNIYVQLGIGAAIRRSLKLSGIDLNDQTRNQSLAQRAYAEALVTIDLKAASDTISYEVVKYLLPHRWFELLALARCDYTQVDGEYVPLEKFSSMGNGYTFELESLVFYTAILAVAPDVDPEKVGVYGDDIVCPAACAEELIDYLNFLGFEVNIEKTFTNGSFFESCGCDFFRGVNVRPFFLRSAHFDFWSIAYDYANSIRLFAHRLRNEDGCDRRLLPAWLRCYRSVPESRRYRVPVDHGSGGFFSDLSEAAPRVDIGIFGWRFKYRHLRPQRAVISEQGCLTASLASPGLFGADKSSSSEALRGRFDGATTKYGRTSVWSSLGSWV